MATVWYILLAFMLTAYVVLDGFDLGAGVLHLLIARTNEQRRLVLRTIGPVWDGNEVWLLAAGGTLYFAFPVLYASAFSGFYLPLMMVLWLLILRAIGIEFRMHLETAVWRGFFDGVLVISSVLLTIFFGAAFGNVLRGVPLDATGYFFAPLWTNWRVGPDPGILDWYTVIAAVVALVTLTLHGAHYVALKTEDPLRERARRVAAILWPVLLALTFVSLIATISIRPQLAANYHDHPIGLVVPVIVFGSMAAMLYFRTHGKDRGAFLSSSAYLIAMLGGAAFALYPNVLPASGDPAHSLTIYNTATGMYSLRLGLFWWVPGMILAIGYFVFVYRMFRGKVRLQDEGY